MLRAFLRRLKNNSRAIPNVGSDFWIGTLISLSEPSSRINDGMIASVSTDGRTSTFPEFFKFSLRVLIFIIGLNSFSEMHAQAVGEVWRQVDSVPDVYASGRFMKAEPDGNGGIYALVCVDGDIEMVHYDSSLNIIWRSHFESNTYQYDEGKDFVVTSNGLIYITGNVWEPFSDANLFVACLDINGVILWERNWDGVATLGDFGYCIAVLPNGNVVVGGKTEITSSHYYGVIMLWSATGNYLTRQEIISTSWWSGLNNCINRITALPDGRIVGCGSYKNTLNGNAGILSCYDSTLSTLLWSNVQSSGINYDDVYTAMSLSANRICIGGTIEDASKLIIQEFDYAGNLLWTVDTIAARDCGDILYTSSGSVAAIFTNGRISAVQFTAWGSYMWRYDYTMPLSPSASLRFPMRMATDQNGNIFLAARSFQTLSDYDQLLIGLSTLGTQQWLIRRDGTGAGSDYDYLNDVVYSGNHLFAVGAIADSVLHNNVPSVFRSTSAGVLSYSNAIPEIGGRLGPSPCMTIDTNGNSFLAGRAPFTASNDLYVSKRDPDGHLLWAHVLTDSGSTYPQGICTDPSGNVYIVCYTGRITSGNDILTCKYDATGNLEWTRVYSSPGNSADVPRAVCSDAIGNIYVAIQVAGNCDVLKYNTNGSLIWTRSYTGTSSAGPDNPSQIMMDGDEVVYIAMQEYNLTTGRDIGVLKVDSAGTTLWHTTWATSGTDEPKAIALFDDRSLALGGTSANPITGYDFLAMRIDTEGTVLWDTLYEQSGTTAGDQVKDVVCRAGKMYLSGFVSVSSSAQSSSFFVLVLDTTGNEVWQHTMFLNSSSGNSIAVSPVSGIVGVCGGDNFPNGFLTVFFDSSGTILDTAIVGIDNQNAAHTIEAHGRSFIVNGTIEYNHQSYMYPTSVSMTVKYCQGQVVTCAADTNICAGGYALLSADSGFTSYQWSPVIGLSTDSIANPLSTPASSINYTVTATNSYGCISSATQQVAVLPTPSIGLLPSTANICAGDTLTVIVQNVISCIWQPSVYTADTIGLINMLWPPSSQMFYLTGTDAWGCSSPDSVSITVSTPPVLQFALADTVCLSTGAIVLSATPPGGNFSGIGVSGNTFDPLIADTGTFVIYYSYSDTVTGCSSSISENVIVHHCVGIIGNDDSVSIEVFPIPADEEIIVRLAAPGPARIDLYDNTGNRVLTQYVTQGDHKVSLYGLASGLYFYQIVSDTDLLQCGRLLKN
jgi:hypothetical protein